MEPLESVSYPHPAGYRDLDVRHAAERLGEFVCIDVREPAEWTDALGHIGAARLVPLATVIDAAAGWDRSKTYLLICRSGGRSGRAAAALAQMGFSRLYNLTGGMLAWNEAKLPVER